MHKPRVVYATENRYSKVTVRGMGVLKPDQQLENLIDWLSKMQGALPEPALV